MALSICFEVWSWVGNTEINAPDKATLVFQHLLEWSSLYELASLPRNTDTFGWLGSGTPDLVSFQWLWGCVWEKSSNKWHCGVWGSLCKCQVHFHFLKNGFSSESDRDIGDIVVSSLPLYPVVCPVHLYWGLPWAVESKGKTGLLFTGEVRIIGK